jgi:hypothetical protein
MHLNIVPTPGFSVGTSISVPFTLNLVDICHNTTFIPFTVPNFEVLKQMPNFKMDNYIDFGYLDTFAGMRGVYCGPVTYQLVNPVQNQPVPSYIYVDSENQRLVVNLGDNVDTTMIDHFSDKLVFQAIMQNYTYINYTCPFYVTLGMAGYGCLYNPGVTFTTGDPSMTFGILFANYTFTKDLKFTKDIQPSFLDNGMNPIPQPGFVSYNPSTRLFTINNP